MDILKNRLISKCGQYTYSQLNQIDHIKQIENYTSDAEVLREAFDFFVEKKYPQLMKIEN